MRQRIVCFTLFLFLIVSCLSTFSVSASPVGPARAAAVKAARKHHPAVQVMSSQAQQAKVQQEESTATQEDTQAGNMIIQEETNSVNNDDPTANLPSVDETTTPTPSLTPSPSLNKHISDVNPPVAPTLPIDIEKTGIDDDGSPYIIPARPKKTDLSPRQGEIAAHLLLNTHHAHHGHATWGPWLLWNFLRVLGYILLVLLFSLWWIQSYILYMPSFGRADESRQIKANMTGYQSPKEYNINLYEDVWLHTPDQEILHAWILLQKDSYRCPTIIFLHGNAGNIGFRLPNAKSLYHSVGCNILLLDYRGYGNSSGVPSENGLAIDAITALNYLRSRPDIDKSTIFLFGRSLGGGVSFDLAARFQHQLCGVMVENTFTCIDDVVIVLAQRLGITRGHFLIRHLLYFILTSHWNSLQKVGNLTIPILFISGLRDELIPPAHMRALYEAATQSRYRSLYEIATGTHNDTYVKGGASYYQNMSSFVQKSIKLVNQNSDTSENPEQTSFSQVETNIDPLSSSDNSSAVDQSTNHLPLPSALAHLTSPTSSPRYHSQTQQHTPLSPATIS